MKSKKYKVEMGSLVTKFMRRSFVVRANSEAEAIKKAETMFRKACERHIWTECGDTVNCDSITEVQDD